MTGKTIFRPLDNRHRMKPKGQWTLRRLTEGYAHKGGDVDSFTHSFEINEEPVYSNEYPEKTKVFTDLTQVDVKGKFTARMLTSALMAVATLSDEGELTQAAANDQTKTVTCPVDSVIPLGKRDVTVDSVKSGSVVYDLGVHYGYDSQSGSVEILKHADGVVLTNGKAPVTVTFDAAQITSRRKWSLASMVSQRFEIVFIQNSKWGSLLVETTFHNVQLRPAGDFVYVADGDDFGTMEFEFEAFPDEVTGEIGTVVERIAA